MHLDLPTLVAMESFVTACTGALLFIAWWHNRKTSVLFLWASAAVVGSGGIVFLVLGLTSRQPLWTILGGGLLALGPGLVWKAARTFDAKPAPLVLVFLGVVVVVLASSVPGMRDVAQPLSFATGAVYLLAAATTLWLGRKDGLVARWPIMIFMAVHAVVLLIGAYTTSGGSAGQDAIPPLMSLFGTVHFESIIFAVGSAVSILILVNEREGAASIMAAGIDGLTGISNHVAWFEGARRLLNRCRQEGSPFSLIMFDLDRFKAVNDTYGHQAGDRVLRAFADTVRGVLRPNDLFGRYGGEEFTVVLPGATIETAYVIAERVRHAFADSHRFLDGQPLNATVSAGVASASPGATLETTIEAADKAMYTAKKAGRDCVKRAVDGPLEGSGKVIRVA